MGAGHSPSHQFHRHVDVLARVFLVTVHDPICTESGNLEAALYGSFLPIPDENLFPAHDVSAYDKESLPGAIIAKKERIIINKGRNRIGLKVTNNGDRPIQVILRFFELKGCLNAHVVFVDRLPLSLYRDQFRAVVRSRQSLWNATRYPSGDRRSLRTW